MRKPSGCFRRLFLPCPSVLLAAFTALSGSPTWRLCRLRRRQGLFSHQQHWNELEPCMPDPIPRNRSARGPAPRRPERHGVWQGRLFRRPQGNPGQPPPRGPRHAARQEAWPGRLFRRPWGNAGQPRPSRSQPRHAAPPPPRTPTQPRTEVVAGVLILAVAVLAGIVVLGLLPSESSSAPPADPARSGTGARSVSGHRLVQGPTGVCRLDRPHPPDLQDRRPTGRPRAGFRRNRAGP